MEVFGKEKCWPAHYIVGNVRYMHLSNDTGFGNGCLLFVGHVFSMSLPIAGANLVGCYLGVTVKNRMNAFGSYMNCCRLCVHFAPSVLVGGGEVRAEE